MEMTSYKVMSLQLDTKFLVRKVSVCSIFSNVHDVGHIAGIHTFLNEQRDFPGGPVVKNPSANAGDTGSSPGPGRSHMPRSN